MENQQSTHFIFDGKKIILSPDLQRVFYFLKGIEVEVETFLSFDKKLESIRKQYLETLNLVQAMSRKLQAHSIDFKFNLSEHPNTIADKLKMDRPVRSKLIVLFAYLETLFCLHIAYESNTSDKKAIIKKAMDPKVVKSFLNNFCLNKENKWSKNNQKRTKDITANNLRDLRNSLTHFFSVDKNLQVADAVLDDKSRKLEKLIPHKAKFISPEDLYEIVKDAGMLIMKKWSDDYLKSFKEKSNEFSERISFVDKTVKDYGAIAIRGDQVNL